MKKEDAKRQLRGLYKEMETRAKACETEQPKIAAIMRFNMQGIVLAAERLEIEIIPNDRQEPDHPNTLLPFPPIPDHKSSIPNAQ